MNRILLTGNTGYIGTVMTKLLKEGSFYVTGLDVNWFEEKCLFKVPDEFKPDKQIIKDIREVDASDLDGVDAVIHLAGLSNDPLGEINQTITEDINYKACIKLAKICKEQGIGRFIFASSCSIYGISSQANPIDETGTVKPLTAYAKTKVQSEQALTKLADDYFHPVFLRNATVYGLSPRLRLDLVVNNLLASAYLTGEITIMSDGTPWRPIIHIEDFCNAFIATLKAPVSNIHCKAMNVGLDEENYQVKSIAYEIRKILPKCKIKILNKTGSDERSYKVDFKLIKEFLPDFKPKWDLKKGILQLLEAFSEYNLKTEDFEAEKYFRIRTIRSLLSSEILNKDLMLASKQI